MKRLSEVNNLQSIRSMASTGKRAIPKAQSSAYLDLYVLSREKHRLEKEIFVLNRRKNNIQKRLKHLNKEMGKMQKTEEERKLKGSKDATKNLSPKKMKTMHMSY